MEYSKLNSNHSKGLKLTTSTNICKVNNYCLGDIFSGLDKETIAFIKREQKKKELLMLQENLIEISKHTVNIRDHGLSYIKASKPK